MASIEAWEALARSLGFERRRWSVQGEGSGRWERVRDGYAAALWLMAGSPTPWRVEVLHPAPLRYNLLATKRPEPSLRGDKLQLMAFMHRQSIPCELPEPWRLEAREVEQAKAWCELMGQALQGVEGMVTIDDFSAARDYAQMPDRAEVERAMKQLRELSLDAAGARAAAGPPEWERKLLRQWRELATTRAWRLDPEALRLERTGVSGGGSVQVVVDAHGVRTNIHQRADRPAPVLSVVRRSGPLDDAATEDEAWLAQALGSRLETDDPTFDDVFLVRAEDDQALDLLDDELRNALLGLPEATQLFQLDGAMLGVVAMGALDVDDIRACLVVLDAVRKRLQATLPAPVPKRQVHPLNVLGSLVALALIAAGLVLLLT
ncbi:MAG: hypothetical protein R3F59_29415 [Myxococcota bacterium]